MAVVAGVLGGMLAAAGPASAGEVGRTHPTGIDPEHQRVTDSDVILVKYYDAGKYEFCVDDSHSPISTVSDWSGTVDWQGAPDQSIPKQRGLWCSGFKAYHGSESVNYSDGVRYSGTI